jgi:uncharacterized SAM-binding protein YcdF (DUF218 family)
VARPRFLRLKLLAACLLLAAAAILSHSLWLPLLGYGLIHDDGPAKADIAVVLAGDQVGHRIEKAAELIRQGYVPAALISGAPGFYGLHECEFEIAYAIRLGFPPQWFIALPHSALNTRDEALVVLAELRRRNVRSFLLVTSDYHTARARRIFLAAGRAMAGVPAMRMVAAPDEFFRPDSWWRNREGQKTVFFEWSKTVATALGI